MPKPDFEQVFRDRLRDIETEAHEVGLNMTSVCERAGIGRATPDRWKRATPQTVKLVSEMERVIDEERARRLKELGRRR